jgi:hypothetical protein
MHIPNECPLELRLRTAVRAQKEIQAGNDIYVHNVRQGMVVCKVWVYLSTFTVGWVEVAYGKRRLVMSQVFAFFLFIYRLFQA